MPRIPAFLIAALVPLAIAGCFPNPDYRDLPDQRVIGSHTQTLATLVVADINAPTVSEQAEIGAQLSAAGDTGVRVRVLLARNAAQTPDLDLRRQMADLGIPPGIAVLERASGSDQTRLVFERTELTPPDCSQLVTPNETWTFATSTYASPRPSMAFGCATYTNLSRMIADPADLKTPHALGEADGTTSAAAIDRYQRNAVTPLRKTTSTQKGGASQ